MYDCNPLSIIMTLDNTFFMIEIRNSSVTCVIGRHCVETTNLQRSIYKLKVKIKLIFILFYLFLGQEVIYNQ